MVDVGIFGEGFETDFEFDVDVVALLSAGVFGEDIVAGQSKAI